MRASKKLNHVKIDALKDFLIGDLAEIDDYDIENDYLPQQDFFPFDLNANLPGDTIFDTFDHDLKRRPRESNSDQTD